MTIVTHQKKNGADDTLFFTKTNIRDVFLSGMFRVNGVSNPFPDAPWDWNIHLHFNIDFSGIHGSVNFSRSSHSHPMGLRNQGKLVRGLKTNYRTHGILSSLDGIEPVPSKNFGRPYWTCQKSLELMPNLDVPGS